MDFVICLLYPASSTKPPISQAIRSKHSSDSKMAMYMSWTRLIMFSAGLSSLDTSLFLLPAVRTGTVVTLGKRRNRAAAIRIGMMIMDMALSPPWTAVSAGPEGAPDTGYGAPNSGYGAPPDYGD